MARKASESLKNGQLTIEPNHYHNQWLLWLDNSKYIIYIQYECKLIYVKTINIFSETGVSLDNFGGVIDYHYLKLNMVGFLRIA